MLTPFPAFNPGLSLALTPVQPSVEQPAADDPLAGDASTLEPGTTNPAAGGGAPPPAWYGLLSSPLIPLILIFVVFYFFMISGNRRKEKERAALISSLARGDRVTTIGGIIGNVVDASGDEVVLKIDESNNTKIRITRSAVASVSKTDGGEKKR